MNGVIFDVQRFSVHDGPGIRTTVFMKGCSLRCRWCHNPEGLSPEPQLRYDRDRCIGCGRCGTRGKLTDAEGCPGDGLKICGSVVSEEEIAAEIAKDRAYYGDTGGVTFSGGECLLQADFVAAVLARVKAMGLHCAIDTAGFVPWSAIEKTLDGCDLYLYDVKCMDPARHKEYTGADNTRILANLKRLAGRGKEIWIRVPVIPGFNDTEREMTAIADLVQGIPAVTQVTLMPYHSLGVSKYRTLGLPEPFQPPRRITDQEMDAFRRIFVERNMNVL